MSEIDVSPEAVERMAGSLESVGLLDPEPCAVADMLRAQAARIKDLEAQRWELIAALEVAAEIPGSNRCQVFVRAYAAEEAWAVADVAKHIAALGPSA